MLLSTAIDYLFSPFSAGIFSVAWLVVLFLVLRNIWDGARSQSGKVLWSLGVFFFPIVGVLCWWMFGGNQRQYQ